MLMHILAPSTIKALLRAPRARRPKPVRSAGGYNAVPHDLIGSGCFGSLYTADSRHLEWCWHLLVESHHTAYL